MGINERCCHCNPFGETQISGSLWCQTSPNSLSRRQDVVSWADTRQNQTPVNSPNRKTNVCVIARAPFLSLQLSLGSIKQKKCIKEFCVMEYLSLSVCRLKTTLPDQALPWQFRSSKAFNILSSHRERSHHKQLNSAWHLSRRWEMQKSQVLVEGAALQRFSGHGRRLSSVHAHK